MSLLRYFSIFTIILLLIAWRMDICPFYLLLFFTLITIIVVLIDIVTEKRLF